MCLACQKCYRVTKVVSKTSKKCRQFDTDDKIPLARYENSQTAENDFVAGNSLETLAAC